MIRSGLIRIKCSHICWMNSSSIWRIRLKSSSRVISISVYGKEGNRQGYGTNLFLAVSICCSSSQKRPLHQFLMGSHWGSPAPAAPPPLHHAEEASQPAYLTLSFLVLQRTVQQDDAGVLDGAPHSGVSDVFIEHDPAQDTRILYKATRNLEGGVTERTAAIQCQRPTTSLCFLSQGRNSRYPP